MDTILGVAYEGGVVLAADQSNAHSILTYLSNMDKITELTTHSAMGVSGPNADSVSFSDYMAKNLALYQLSNDGSTLSTRAQANFARDELAHALRKGPYQVNILLAGFDDRDGGSLYYLDYMAALQKVNYACQGHATFFCSSIMDREWKEHMSQQEAIDIIDKCVRELEVRFIIHQPNFMVKAIDKDGVKVIKFGQDPADT